MVVRDLELGTNDCRGWIRKSLFEKLALPEGHFYQFRLAFEDTQAKGSFKVMADEVADALGRRHHRSGQFDQTEHQDASASGQLVGLWISRLSRCPIVLGIREVSRPLQFESSYTVLQHAPAESIETEIVPQAVETIETLKTAWREGNHRKVVELIGQEVRQTTIPRENSSNGLSKRHCWRMGQAKSPAIPYVHAQLSRLMARWAYKLMTGGGIELPAFALADDGFLVLQQARSCPAPTGCLYQQPSPPVPSNRGLCVRYPVRMNEDLLPLEHLQGEKLDRNT